jgi:hypothetical protein
MPPIRQIDPGAYSTLESQIRTFIKTAKPKIINEAAAAQKTFGPGNQASMGETVVRATIAGVFTVVAAVVCAKPSDIGSEMQAMQEASIRAIAKQAVNEAAARF